MDAVNTSVEVATGTNYIAKGAYKLFGNENRTEEDFLNAYGEARDMLYMAGYTYATFGQYALASGFASQKSESVGTSSEIAQSWQGKGKYPGVDTYKNITLKEGKVIYRGEPNGTDYFTTQSAIERSGNSATNIFKGLQVEKNSVHGYRGVIQGYKTTTNVHAAFGIAKANPQFGQGGLPQVFVPNVEELIKEGVLVPVDSVSLVE